MVEPSLSTLKRLFALSGNRCAFPGCDLPIVEQSGVVTGIVCHINARSKGGPRYDSEQTPEERHGYENLVLMCARHSKFIDSDPKKYTVDLLHEMKKVQEKSESVEFSESDAPKIEALLKEYRAVYITAGGHVVLNSPGSVQAFNVTIHQSEGNSKPLFEVYVHPRLDNSFGQQSLQIPAWLTNQGLATADDVVVVLQKQPLGVLGLNYDNWKPITAAFPGTALALKNPLHPGGRVFLCSVNLGLANAAFEWNDVEFRIKILAKDQAPVDLCVGFSCAELKSMTGKAASQC